MELGSLATEAALRGDDRAVATLRSAAELLFADKSAVDALEELRRGEEARRTRDRERRPVQNPRIPRKSTESSEIGGIQTASQGFSPTPPFPNPPDNNDNTTARVKKRAVTQEEKDYADVVELYTGMLVQRVGPLWPDVDGFIKRREYATWVGWIKEMLALITGGQGTVQDLAQVCRDDQALERKIATPKGLRIFMGSAQRERLHGNGNGTRAKTGPGERSYHAAKAALEDL